MEFFLVALLVLLGIAFSLSLLNRLRRQGSREQLERSTPLSEPEFDFSRIAPADEGSNREMDLPLDHPPLLTAPATLAELVPLIRQYRDDGELEKAQTLCEQHLPKTRAFQQLLMTQRSALKTLMQQQEDATQALDRLYTIAVIAELYRSSRNLPGLVLQSRHACNLLQQFRPDYQQLGYANLRGLTRADIALLVRRRGEPRQHQHPVTALPPTWWRLDPAPFSGQS